MLDNTTKILDLIKRRPGIRLVSISDALDIDVELVKNALSELMGASKVKCESTIGPNKLTTLTYTSTDNALGWIQPVVVKDLKIPGEINMGVAVSPDASQLAVVQVSVPPSISQPKLNSEVHTMSTHNKLSKATVAFNHLLQHGETTPEKLRDVMGLVPPYSASQYLTHQIKRGIMVRVNGNFDLSEEVRSDAMSGKQKLPRTTVEKHVESDNKQLTSLDIPQFAEISSQSHDTSTDHPQLVALARKALTETEFQGFVKGQLISLATSGHQRGISVLYAKLLTASEVDA